MITPPRISPTAAILILANVIAVAGLVIQLALER